ncbi:MAG: M56 family metallopeptidase, partial [Gelidibacter sp.]
MLHYILQTVAFQVFFLIIYDVFLKNETFFNWNRAYLIGTAFLSFTLPFLKFESIKAIVPEPMIIRLPEVIIGEVSPILIDSAMMVETEQISEQAMSFSWTYVWVIGMVLTALILAYKIIKIMRMLYKNPQRWQGDALIVFLLNSSAAFSFFHYIFLGSNIEAAKKEHIVQHEMVHVKEKHSVDLLVFEVLRIVFWFNPLIYMYQNRLSILHEFIADAKAVKYKGKSEYYQSLLSEVFETQQISFINPFFHQSLIKKRILMLSKSKSKKIHLMKYALLAPVVMVMLMYTSSYASAVKDPFPLFQKQVLNQELTFQELVDKYYNEISAWKGIKEHFSKINEEYFKREDNYIESRDIVARRQAFMKYMLIEIREEKESEGELSDADVEKHEKRINRFKTYQDYLDFKKTDVAKKGWENMGRSGEVRLVVDNVGKLTDAEQKRKAEKMALIDKDDFYNKLTITDGKSSTTLDFGKNDAQGKKESFEPADIEVPFAVIDEVPLFEGCEPSESTDADKDCTSQKIAEFVNKNYNTNLATELGLIGRQRINVIFKIGKDGKVRDVMS